MKALSISSTAIAALFSSCAIPDEGAYGSASYGYDSGYYGHGYNSWNNGHGHSNHHRHVKTPFTSKDDARKDADHRTSPDYRDPHHGGSKHGHDDAGHRVDSHGHHVDAVGNHTSTSHGGSDNHSRDNTARSDSSRSAPESSRRNPVAATAATAPAAAIRRTTSGNEGRTEAAGFDDTIAITRADNSLAPP